MHKLFNQSYITDAKKHRVCQKESLDLKLLYYLKKMGIEVCITFKNKWLIRPYKKIKLKRIQCFTIKTYNVHECSVCPPLDTWHMSTC